MIRTRPRPSRACATAVAVYKIAIRAELSVLLKVHDACFWVDDTDLLFSKCLDCVYCRHDGSWWRIATSRLDKFIALSESSP